MGGEICLLSGNSSDRIIATSPSPSPTALCRYHTKTALSQHRFSCQFIMVTAIHLRNNHHIDALSMMLYDDLLMRSLWNFSAGLVRQNNVSLISWLQNMNPVLCSSVYIIVPPSQCRGCRGAVSWSPSCCWAPPLFMSTQSASLSTTSGL